MGNFSDPQQLVPPLVESHPLGCHRPRASDRDCFEVIVVRLATGCSWEDAERLCGNKVSDTTVRHRRDEWIAAGVFDAIAAEATRGVDRVIGLDLSDVALDGSLHKSPCGGEGTGKNPTDRGKLGWKWSVLTDRNGIPIGWAIDGANRNDSVLLAPTLDDAAARGLLGDIETIWLDRGYDSAATRERLAERDLDDAVIAKKRKRGSAGPKKNQPMGLRWPVERTNSWLSNFGPDVPHFRSAERQSVSSAETPTGRPCTGSPSSRSPSPSCSPPSSSTGETAGQRTSRLSAEPLTRRETNVWRFTLEAQ